MSAREDELARQVEHGLARCMAIAERLGHRGSLDDLPEVAARAVAELEKSRAALAELHAKAKAIAEHRHQLQEENVLLRECVALLADEDDAAERKRMARTVADGLLQKGEGPATSM